MDLSVIIVNWNTRTLLLSCLASVYRTIEGLSFEVWLVDNASSDGSVAAAVKNFPGIRVIENPAFIRSPPADRQERRRHNPGNVEISLPSLDIPVNGNIFTESPETRWRRMTTTETKRA